MPPAGRALLGALLLALALGTPARAADEPPTPSPALADTAAFLRDADAVRDQPVRFTGRVRATGQHDDLTLLVVVPEGARWEAPGSTLGVVVGLSAPADYPEGTCLIVTGRNLGRLASPDAIPPRDAVQTWADLGRQVGVALATRFAVVAAPVVQPTPCP